MTKEYTHKTRKGNMARLVCSDAVGGQPLVFLILGEDNQETAHRYTNNLMHFTHDTSSPMDLIEFSIWDDVEIDTPIWFYDDWHDRWMPLHFAGMKIKQFLLLMKVKRAILKVNILVEVQVLADWKNDELFT